MDGRTWALNRYCRLREATTPDGAVAGVVTSLGESPVDVNPGLVWSWARQDDWETVYRDRRAMGLPADPSDPSDVVAALYTQVARARTLVDEAFELAREADGRVPSHHEKRDYREADARYTKLLDQLETRRLKAERGREERQLLTSWSGEVRDATEGLLALYGSRGEHYRILCRAVAPVAVKLNHALDLRLDTDEHDKLMATLCGTIAQLQKHTEATRTEAATEHVIDVVLGVVERHLGQPRKFLEIVQDPQIREMIPARAQRAAPAGG